MMISQPAQDKSGRDAGAVRRFRKRAWLLLLGTVVAIYVATALYHSVLRELPADVSLEGRWHTVGAEEIEFLADVTGIRGPERVSEQVIFDRVLRLIAEAEDFVLVDLFLFNEYRGNDGSVHRRLCHEVASALIEKKRSRPTIALVVITDPVNEVYGGPVPEPFRAMRAAGIPVVVTDLSQLRDSNPVYSGFWRLCVQWFGNSARGWLPHPFAKDAGKVTLRSWLALLNFKANHRKLVVADAPDGRGARQLVSMVLSANPHDASSAHSNVGLLVRSGVWRDLVRSEQAILSFSGAQLDLESLLPPYARDRAAQSPLAAPNTAQVRVLTEGKIRKGILEGLASSGPGDRIDVAMFYLSERSIIQGLLDAAARGAVVRVLLDPNRDAFGYEKSGVPNRPVAAELVERSGRKIQVRWANTRGEQFHSKLVLVRQGRQATVFAGSANLTRRNIGDYNLETDLVVTGPADLKVLAAAVDYFERLWSNRDVESSLAFEAFGASRFLQWQGWIQERTGLASF